MPSKLWIAAGLSVVALSAHAAAENELSDWDTNGDGHITQSEWGNSCTDSNLFTNWDTDNDGLIDDDEYATGLFRHWDSNGDGVLEENEWTKANQNWFDDYSTQFSAWDSDSDGYVEYREFDSGFGKTSWYADWDRNNTLFIEKDDFCQSLFNQADADRDGRINVGDYDTEFMTWFVY